MFTVTISRASENLTHMLIGVGPRIVSYKGEARSRSPKVARRLALERLYEAQDKAGNAGACVQFHQVVRKDGKIIEVKCV